MRPGFHKVVGMEVRFIKVVLREKKNASDLRPPYP
jgi:hypothetical protein